MVLAIDIGNSSIKAGLFTDSLTTRSIPTHPRKSSAEYMEVLEGIVRAPGMDKGPCGVVISSVVQGHSEAVREAARQLCGTEPLVVGPERTGGLKIDVKSPYTLGPDRIASAVAASAMLGAPVAVVDFGTATTVNFTGIDGKETVFRGGTIMPGLGMMLRALKNETSRLPLVTLREIDTPLGRDTEGNILSGVVVGSAGAVEKIIRSVEKTRGEQYRVAVTGGFMGYVLPHMGKVDLAEPALTLKGLKIIYERETQCMN